MSEKKKIVEETQFAQVTVAPQIVYLDFDGEKTNYNGEILSVSDVSVEDSGLTQERIEKIASVLNEKYSSSNVVFVTEKPSSGDFSTVFVGKTSSFEKFGSFAGIAEDIDAGNLNKNDNAFVILDASSSDESIVSTIAHETDHLLGTLDHGGEGLARYMANYENIIVNSNQTYSDVALESVTVTPTVSMTLTGSKAEARSVFLRGSMFVQNGAKAIKNYVSAGGYLQVSGGSASQVTISSGGYAETLSGGITEVEVSSGGQLYIGSNAGAYAEYITLSLGGILGRFSFASECYFEKITAGSGKYEKSGEDNFSFPDMNTLLVSGGQTLNSATVHESGGLGVQGIETKKGTVNNITVSGTSATLTVSAGGSASATKVYTGAVINILNQGRADNTVLNGGTIIVGSGGSAVEATGAGTIIVSSGGTAAGVTFDNLTMSFYLGSGTEISGTNEALKVENGVLYDSSYFDATYYVVKGGSISNQTFINGKKILFVSGGTAVSNTVGKNGNVVISQGVMLLTGNSGNLTVAGTGSASGVSGAGSLTAQGKGQFVSAIVNNGGKMLINGVASAVLAKETTIDAGGSLTVMQGIVSSSIISGKASVNVTYAVPESGAVDTRNSSKSTLKDTKVESGGSLTVNYNATLTGHLDVNGTVSVRGITDAAYRNTINFDLNSDIRKQALISDFKGIRFSGDARKSDSLTDYSTINFTLTPKETPQEGRYILASNFNLTHGNYIKDGTSTPLEEQLTISIDGSSDPLWIADKDASIQSNEVTITEDDGKKYTYHLELVKNSGVSSGYDLYLAVWDEKNPEITLTVTPTGLCETASISATVDEDVPIFYTTDSDYTSDTANWIAYTEPLSVNADNITYTFKAPDQNGRTNYESYTFSNVDNTAPVLTVAANTTVPQQSVTVSFSVEDSHKDVSGSNLNIYYLFSDTPLDTASMNKLDWTNWNKFTANDQTLTENGYYYYKVKDQLYDRGYDTEKHVSEIQELVVQNIDRDGSNLHATVGKPVTYDYYAEITVKGEETGKEDYPSKLQYSMDNGITWTDIKADNNNVYTATALKTGTYLFREVDYAGNVQTEAYESYTFASGSFDDQAPEFTFSVNGDIVKSSDEIISTSVKLKVSATDLPDGVSYDGTNLNIIGWKYDNSKWTYASGNVTFDGTTLKDAVATDTTTPPSGWKYNTKNKRWTYASGNVTFDGKKLYQNGAVATDATTPPSGWKYDETTQTWTYASGDVTFDGTTLKDAVATDTTTPPSGWEYDTEQSKWSYKSGNVSYDGTNLNIIGWTYDTTRSKWTYASGDVTFDGATLYKNDEVVPTDGSTTPPDGWTYDTTAKKWTYTRVNLNTFYFSEDNDAWSPYSPATTEIKKTTEGVYTYYFKVEDVYGHQATESISFTIYAAEDTMPPTISFSKDPGTIVGEYNLVVTMKDCSEVQYLEYRKVGSETWIKFPYSDAENSDWTMTGDAGNYTYTYTMLLNKESQNATYEFRAADVKGNIKSEGFDTLTVDWINEKQVIYLVFADQYNNRGFYQDSVSYKGTVYFEEENDVSKKFTDQQISVIIESLNNLFEKYNVVFERSENQTGHSEIYIGSNVSYSYNMESYLGSNFVAVSESVDKKNKTSKDDWGFVTLDAKADLSNVINATAQIASFLTGIYDNGKNTISSGTLSDRYKVTEDDLEPMLFVLDFDGAETKYNNGSYSIESVTVQESGINEETQKAIIAYLSEKYSEDGYEFVLASDTETLEKYPFTKKMENYSTIYVGKCEELTKAYGECNGISENVDLISGSENSNVKWNDNGFVMDTGDTVEWSISKIVDLLVGKETNSDKNGIKRYQVLYPTQVFYLKFDGAQTEYNNGDYSKKPVTVTASGIKDAVREEIADKLNAMYEAFNIKFIYEREIEETTEIEEHSTIYIGKCDELANAYGTFDGISESVDAGIENKKDNGFVTLDKNSSTTDIILTVSMVSDQLLGTFDNGKTGIDKYKVRLDAWNHKNEEIDTTKIYSNETFINTIIDPAVSMALDGSTGLANRTYAYGSMIVSSGAVAFNTIVSSGGFMWVDSDGTARTLYVLESGRAYLSHGAMSNVIVSSGGTISINKDDSKAGIVDLQLKSGGVLGGFSFNNDFEFEKISGGKAETRISSCSTISSGTSDEYEKLDYDFVIRDMLTIWISSGGFLSSATVHNSGGIGIWGTDASSGGLAHGIILDGANAGLTVSQYGRASETVVRNGRINVLSGGTAVSTFLSGGLMAVFDGGTASGINGTTNATLVVSAGGSVTGLNNEPFNINNFSCYIDSRTLVLDTDGCAIVSNGNLQGNQNGTYYILNGATVANQTFNNQVVFHISSGGSVRKSKIGSSAAITLAEGEIVSTTIGADGRFVVEHGGVASTAVLAENATMSLGGTATSVTAAGGATVVLTGGLLSSGTLYGEITGTGTIKDTFLGSGGSINMGGTVTGVLNIEDNSNSSKLSGLSWNVYESFSSLWSFVNYYGINQTVKLSSGTTINFNLESQPGLYPDYTPILANFSQIEFDTYDSRYRLFSNYNFTITAIPEQEGRYYLMSDFYMFKEKGSSNPDTDEDITFNIVDRDGNSFHNMSSLVISADGESSCTLTTGYDVTDDDGNVVNRYTYELILEGRDVYLAVYDEYPPSMTITVSPGGFCESRTVTATSTENAPIYYNNISKDAPEDQWTKYTDTFTVNEDNAVYYFKVVDENNQTAIQTVDFKDVDNTKPVLTLNTNHVPQQNPSVNLTVKECNPLLDEEGRYIVYYYFAADNSKPVENCTALWVKSGDNWTYTYKNLSFDGTTLLAAYAHAAGWTYDKENSKWTYASGGVTFDGATLYQNDVVVATDTTTPPEGWTYDKTGKAWTYASGDVVWNGTALTKDDVVVEPPAEGWSYSELKKSWVYTSTSGDLLYDGTNLMKDVPTDGSTTPPEGWTYDTTKSKWTYASGDVTFDGASVKYNDEELSTDESVSGWTYDTTAQKWTYKSVAGDVTFDGAILKNAVATDTTTPPAGWEYDTTAQKWTYKSGALVYDGTNLMNAVATDTKTAGWTYVVDEKTKVGTWTYASGDLIWDGSSLKQAALHTPSGWKQLNGKWSYQTGYLSCSDYSGNDNYVQLMQIVDPAKITGTVTAPGWTYNKKSNCWTFKSEDLSYDGTNLNKMISTSTTTPPTGWKYVVDATSLTGAWNYSCAKTSDHDELSFDGSDLKEKAGNDMKSVDHSRSVGGWTYDNDINAWTYSADGVIFDGKDLLKTVSTSTTTPPTGWKYDTAAAVWTYDSASESKTDKVTERVLFDGSNLSQMINEKTVESSYGWTYDETSQTWIYGDWTCTNGKCSYTPDSWTFDADSKTWNYNGWTYDTAGKAWTYASGDVTFDEGKLYLKGEVVPTDGSTTPPEGWTYDTTAKKWTYASASGDVTFDGSNLLNQVTEDTASAWKTLYVAASSVDTATNTATLKDVFAESPLDSEDENGTYYFQTKDQLYGMEDCTDSKHLSDIIEVNIQNIDRTAPTETGTGTHAVDGKKNCYNFTGPELTEENGTSYPDRIEYYYSPKKLSDEEIAGILEYAGRQNGWTELLGGSVSIKKNGFYYYTETDYSGNHSRDIKYVEVVQLDDLGPEITLYNSGSEITEESITIGGETEIKLTADAADRNPATNLDGDSYDDQLAVQQIKEKSAVDKDTFEYRVNGAETWTRYTVGTSLTVSQDGFYTYEFRASDTWENESEIKTLKIKVDTKGPSVSVTSSSEGTESVQSVSLVVTIEDKSEIKSISYQHKAASEDWPTDWTEIKYNAESSLWTKEGSEENGYIYTYTMILDSDVSNGDYRFRASDCFDNKTETPAEMTVSSLETTPPVISVTSTDTTSVQSCTMTVTMKDQNTVKYLEYSTNGGITWTWQSGDLAFDGSSLIQITSVQHDTAGWTYDATKSKWTYASGDVTFDGTILKQGGKSVSIYSADLPAGWSYKDGNWIYESGNLSFDGKDLKQSNKLDKTFSESGWTYNRETGKWNWKSDAVSYTADGSLYKNGVPATSETAPAGWTNAGTQEKPKWVYESNGVVYENGKLTVNGTTVNTSDTPPAGWTYDSSEGKWTYYSDLFFNGTEVKQCTSVDTTASVSGWTYDATKSKWTYKSVTGDLLYDGTNLMKDVPTDGPTTPPEGWTYDTINSKWTYASGDVTFDGATLYQNDVVVPTDGSTTPPSGWTYDATKSKWTYKSVTGDLLYDGTNLMKDVPTPPEGWTYNTTAKTWTYASGDVTFDGEYLYQNGDLVAADTTTPPEGWTYDKENSKWTYASGDVVWNGTDLTKDDVVVEHPAEGWTYDTTAKTWTCVSENIYYNGVSLKQMENAAPEAPADSGWIYNWTRVTVPDTIKDGDGWTYTDPAKSADSMHTYTYTMTLSNDSQNGTYCFRASDTVGDGNLTKDNYHEHTIKNLDTTAPVLSIKADLDETGTGMFTITVRKENDMDSVKYSRGTITGSVELKYDSEKEIYTGTLPVENALILNSKYQFTAEDAAQNTSSVSSITVSWDTSRYYTSNLSVNAGFGQTGDVSKKYYQFVPIYMEGDDWKEKGEFSDWIEITADTVYEYTAEANQKLQFKEVDVNGNEAVSAFCYITNIDANPPVLEVNWGDTDTPVHSVNAKITSAGDAESGLQKLEFSSDGINWTSCEIGQDFSITKNGTYYFRATDNAEHCTVKSWEYGNIDWVNPLVSVTLTETAYSSAKAEIKVSDDYKTNARTRLEWKKDGGSWETYREEENAGFSVTVDMEEETDNGIWYFRAIDRAGNVSKVSSVSVSNIDKTGPVFKMVADTTTAAKQSELAIYVSDAHDIKWVKDASGNVLEKDSNRGCYVYNVTENGTYTFTAEDAAGNTASQAICFSNINSGITEDPVVLWTKTGKIEEWKTNLDPLYDGYNLNVGTGGFAEEITVNSGATVTVSGGTLRSVTLRDGSNMTISSSGHVSGINVSGTLNLKSGEVNDITVTGTLNTDENALVSNLVLKKSGTVNTLGGMLSGTIELGGVVLGDGKYTLAPDAQIVLNVTDHSWEDPYIASAAQFGTNDYSVMVDTETTGLYKLLTSVNDPRLLTFTIRDEDGNLLSGGHQYRIAETPFTAEDGKTYSFQWDQTTNSVYLKVYGKGMYSYKPGTFTISVDGDIWAQENETWSQKHTISTNAGNYAFIEYCRVEDEDKQWNIFSTAEGYTVSRNGSYIFRANYYDGSTQDISVNFSKIDTLAPDRLEIFTNKDPNIPTNEIKLSVSVYDAEATSDSASSGIQKYAYSLNGGNSWTSAVTTASGKFTVDLNSRTASELYKYNNVVKFKLWDNAGNMSILDSEPFSNLDVIPPEAEYISLTKGTMQYTKTTTLTASYTDPEDKGVSLYYYCFGKDEVVTDPKWIKYEKTIEVSSDDLTYVFRAQDSAMNNSGTTSIIFDNIDNVSPVLTVSGLPEQPVQSCTLNFSVEEKYVSGLTNAVTVYYRKQGGEEWIAGIGAIYDDASGLYIGSIELNQESQNGIYEFKVTDSAGNESEKDESGKYIFYMEGDKVSSVSITQIDRTPPAAPVISVSTEKPTRDPVEITVTFHEDDSTKYYELGGERHEILPGQIIGNQYIHKVDYNCTISFGEVDVAGNESTSSCTIRNIDSSLPLVEASGENEKILKESELVLTVYSSNEPEWVKICKDDPEETVVVMTEPESSESYPGTELMIYTYKYKITGNGTYYYYVHDGGKEYIASGNYTFNNIDSSAPEHLETVLDPQEPAQEVTITVKFKDSRNDCTLEYSKTDSGSGWESVTDLEWTESAEGGYLYTGTLVLDDDNENGSYIFRMTDMAGNYAETESVTVSNIDTTAPVMSISEEPSSPVQSYTLTAVFEDEKNSLSIEMSEDGGKTWTTVTEDCEYLTIEGLKYTYSRTFESEEYNGKTYAFRAKDAAENEAKDDKDKAIISVTVDKIDTTSPGVPTLLETVTSVKENLLSISVGAGFSDPEPHPEWGDKLTNTYTVNGREGTYVAPVTVYAGETVTFTSKDAAGNTASTTHSVAKLNTNADIKTWTNKNVKVVAAFSKDVTGYYSLTGDTWTEYDTTLNYCEVKDNTYVYFKGVDNENGRITEIGQYYVENIDKKAPTITVDNLKIESVEEGTDKKITFTFVYDGLPAQDYAGGTFYRFNSSDWAKYTESITVPIDPETPITVSFKIVDQAGNDSNVISYIAGAPVITITADTETICRETTLTASADKELQSFRYSTDKISWTDYTEAITVKANGTYYFEAVDKAGNKGTNQVTFTNIDRIAPVITINADNMTLASSVIMTATADDDHLKSFQYSTDEISWTDYTEAITVKANGTYYFKAVDEAGNTAEKSITFDNIRSSKPKELAGNADGLSWSAEAPAKAYIVEFSEDDFASAVIRFTVEDCAINTFALPEGSYDWRVRADEDGAEWSNGSEKIVSDQGEARIWKSETDGTSDIFFANASGEWSSDYIASHNGAGSWRGTGELCSIAGKNQITDVFCGSEDANVLVITDDDDALFIDDIWSESPAKVNGTQRLSSINEILAGGGDDLVDMTSRKYTVSSMTIRGGMGNDTIWAAEGDNYLFGDQGSDRIVGASGNDVIAGGVGNDSMHGGGGNDIFTFCSSWGEDTVDQLSSGTVTLWFAEGSEENWNEETRTYTDGGNKVTVLGSASVTLKFGDDQSETYKTLAGCGAFREYTSQNVFADKENSSKSMFTSKK